MNKNMYANLPFFELKALCDNYLEKKEYHPSIAAYVERLNNKLVDSKLTDEQLNVMAGTKAKAKEKHSRYKAVNKTIMNEIKSIVSSAMQNGAGGCKKAYDALYHAFDEKYKTSICALAREYAASQKVTILVIEYVCDIEQKGNELLKVAKEIFN